MTDPHTEGEPRVFVADPLERMTGGHTLLGKLEVTTTAEVITCADKLAAVRRLATWCMGKHHGDHQLAAEILALCDGDPQRMADWAADRPKDETP